MPTARTAPSPHSPHTHASDSSDYLLLTTTEHSPLLPSSASSAPTSSPNRPRPPRAAALVQLAALADTCTTVALALRVPVTALPPSAVALNVARGLVVAGAVAVASGAHLAPVMMGQLVVRPRSLSLCGCERSRVRPLTPPPAPRALAALDPRPPVPPQRARPDHDPPARRVAQPHHRLVPRLVRSRARRLRRLPRRRRRAAAAARLGWGRAAVGRQRRAGQRRRREVRAQRERRRGVHRGGRGRGRVGPGGLRGRRLRALVERRRRRRPRRRASAHSPLFDLDLGPGLGRARPAQPREPREPPQRALAAARTGGRGAARVRREQGVRVDQVARCVPFSLGARLDCARARADGVEPCAQRGSEGQAGRGVVLLPPFVRSLCVPAMNVILARAKSMPERRRTSGYFALLAGKSKKEGSRRNTSRAAAQLERGRVVASATC